MKRGSRGESVNIQRIEDETLIPASHASILASIPCECHSQSQMRISSRTSLSESEDILFLHVRSGRPSAALAPPVCLLTLLSSSNR
jgi:hypothetical protein